MEASDGHIQVPGGRIWFGTWSPEQRAAPPRLPLLLLHGGPGFSHFYLKPFVELAAERGVILYDQLGCGRSDRPSDGALWTIPRFVDELRALVEHLKLTRFHLLGHSWGSVLALEYALRYQESLASVIMGSPCISVPLWAADAVRLIAQLPKNARKALQEVLRSGSFAVPDFDAAHAEYEKRHIYGSSGITPELHQSIFNSGADVYRAMWGPTEYLPTGSLGAYNGVEKLKQLSLPVLWYAGKYDEATPRATLLYAAKSPRSRCVIFRQSAHHPHITEREGCLSAVQQFLASVEGGSFTPDPRLLLLARGKFA